MLRRFAAASAGGALALMSYSVMVAAPASAGKVPNTVEVTKVVKGENPGGGFEVVVTCEEAPDGAPFSLNNSQQQTLVFGPAGGTDSVGAPFNSTCTVEETGTGGASKVEISGSPCDFTVPEVIEPIVSNVAPPPSRTCEVTVTNTFEPPAAGPQGPPGPPAEPAQAVVSTARFTG
jgi:Domain of unknown function (DUF5979)